MKTKHPNIELLVKRMEAALQRKDYSEVLHASASVFETLAKDIVGTSNVQNQTLKSFFERYKKNSLLPQEFLDSILSLYDLRNVTPLAGHGSTQIPDITREMAIAICEMTKAFVEIEYKLQSGSNSSPDNAQTNSTLPEIQISFSINKEGIITTERAELLASFSEALYSTKKHKVKVIFDVKLEFLEIIQSAISSLNTSIKPEDRITKVKLLNMADEQNNRLEMFIEAIQFLFQDSVRSYFSSIEDFGEVIAGLAIYEFGDIYKDRDSNSHSVDIYRKSEPKLIARIRINEQETEMMVAQLELGNIWQLVDSGGYDFYDLPPEIRYAKGVPAILNCIVWENKKHANSVDLEKALEFSTWKIGLA